MDNNGDSISSSGQTPPPLAMIMPPLPADGPESDEAAARGLENPSSVRNLKDILKFTTEMTASCAKKADADREDAENAGAKSEEAKKADGGVDKDVSAGREPFLVKVRFRQILLKCDFGLNFSRGGQLRHSFGDRSSASVLWSLWGWWLQT